MSVKFFHTQIFFSMTIYFKRLVGICFLFLTLLSCEKNELQTANEKVKDSLLPAPHLLSVQVAKKWFDQDYLKSQKLTETEASKKLVRNIFWDRAYMDKMSNGQDLLIVPLEHHEPENQANADTYLWIFVDDSNRLSAKVIEYLSSASESKNGSEISIVNFSGAMTVRDWNGTLLNGFTFKKGKPAGVLLELNGKETLLISSSKNTRNAGTVCQNLEITTSTCDSYYYKVCFPHLGTCTETRPGGTFCERTSVMVPQCYWVADFPSQTNPYIGGRSDITARSAEQLTIPGFDHPAIDINKFIKCFGVIDNNSKYKVTIYVEEPFAGTGKTAYGKNVGHAFIGLEKNTNGMITRQVVGFYPNAMSTSWGPSHMANNGGDPYTISTTYEPYADGFQSVLNAVIYQQSQMYHIAQYNCTTALAYICDAAGLTFPKNESFFPFFTAKGLSPGRLGVDLRNNQSSGIVNKNGGSAPYSKGPCN